MPEEEPLTAERLVKALKEYQSWRERVCLRCAHVWTPQRIRLGEPVFEEPKACPRCRSREWNVPKPGETPEEAAEREKESERDREHAWANRDLAWKKAQGIIP